MIEGQYTNPNSELCIPIGPFPIGCHTELISEKDIEFILSLYNFFNLEWKDDAETTRLQVPETLRRSGLWITYTHLGERITERFIGADMQAQIPEDWKNDAFWEKLDFEAILNSAEDAFITILRNLDKYPKFKEFLAKLLADLLKNEISLDDIKDLIELHLEDILKNMIPSGYLNALIISIASEKIKEYLNSAAFKNNIKNILRLLLVDEIDNLDCVLGPLLTTPNNIVLWESNDGKHIKDSGVPMCDVVMSISYDRNSKTINAHNLNGDVISTISATDFIKDGMVNTVSVINENLVITFNTDAGKENITIPIDLIFDSDLYYTKLEVNNKLKDYVVGPNSAVDNDIAVYNGTTGKVIKDGGIKIGNILTRLMVNPQKGLVIDNDNELAVDFSLMEVDTSEFERLLKSLKVPIYLNSDKNFYVDYYDKESVEPAVDDDSDPERGKSKAKPWKTLSYALKTITRDYNINTRTVYINVAEGIYNESISTGEFLRTTGRIYVRPYGYSNNPYPYSHRVETIDGEEIVHYDNVILSRTTKSGHILTTDGGKYAFVGIKFDSYTTTLDIYLKLEEFENPDTHLVESKWVTLSELTGTTYPTLISVENNSSVTFVGCDFNFVSLSTLDTESIKYNKERIYVITSRNSNISFSNNCRYFFEKGLSITFLCFRATDYGKITFSGLSRTSTDYYKREFYVEGTWNSSSGGSLFYTELHGSIAAQAAASAYSPYITYRKNLCFGRSYDLNSGGSLLLCTRSNNSGDTIVHIYDENDEIVPRIVSEDYIVDGLIVTPKNVLPGSGTGLISESTYSYLMFSNSN